MSGPPYPRGSKSGAIGEFIIGVSPIGGEPVFDVWRTVLSQYANSDILMALILNMVDCVDQQSNIDNFFDFIWNVDTAQGYGLDVWGRIVGVTRVLHIASGDFFGFSGPPGSSGEPFNQAAFYNGSGLTSNFSLLDNDYRRLIFAKALSNICDGTIKAINQILINLFPLRGNCYATDGNDMTMTYTFEFPLSPVELAIVSQSGVLPKPVGVFATVVSPP